MVNPFPLDALKADARAVAAVLYPGSALETIILRFKDGTKIPLSPMTTESHAPPPGAPPPKGDFQPTAAQWKMMHALKAGKANKKALIAATGDEVYRRGRGGLDELAKEGVVEAVQGGFELTDLGHALLVENEDET